MGGSKRRIRPERGAISPIGRRGATHRDPKEFSRAYQFESDTLEGRVYIGASTPSGVTERGECRGPSRWPTLGGLDFAPPGPSASPASLFSPASRAIAGENLYAGGPSGILRQPGEGADPWSGARMQG